MEKLIWCDEFDYVGPPDPEKWQLEIGGTGNGNNEAQYYTDSLNNAEVIGGRLIITALKETYENKGYSSAKLTTKGIRSFQHGKLLIRAKIPRGKGAWPAIWMMPEAFHEGISWPSCGEIDIMENIGRKEDIIHHSLHTGMYNHRLDNQYTDMKHHEGISDRFAEYGMIWTEDKIEFLIDGELQTGFYKGEKGKDATRAGWPFDQPFYLIMNLAVGGYWGGDIDDDALPMTFEVDYVRFYQIS